MLLSCASPMVPGDTLVAKAQTLRAWGIDAISVFESRDSWSDAAFDELSNLEELSGVVPCEFALLDPIYGRLMDADPATRSASRALYKENIDIAVRLGLITELEFEYRIQDPLPLFEPYQQLTDEQRNDFLTVYRDLVDPAAESDALVLLENLNRYESRHLNRIVDCVDVLEAVNHPRSGLVFDFFHASIEEADIAAAIRLAGSHIKHVHLADNNRLLPGQGDIDWNECFAALRDVGYDGYLTLECSTSGDPNRTMPQAVEYLRGLMN